MEMTGIADVAVSRIGLGTWAIGGLDWGPVSDSVAVATCLSAIDRGINLIDTAPIFGRGHAEEIVGKAIRAHGRRDAFYIATKCGLEWRDDGVVANSAPQRLRRELEDSLRRLETDVIDLYQVHWPDTLIPVADVAGLLAQFQHEGKVRALGVSNFSVAQMEEFRATARLASDQPPYNIFERQIDGTTLPWCQANDVAVLTWSTLCRSLLGGRLQRGMRYGVGDIRFVDPKFQEPRFSQYLTAVGRLEDLAREKFGKTLPQLAARWVLDRTRTGVALWGARRPDQLDAVAGVLGWELDSETMLEIDRIVAESVTDPAGPEYLTPRVRTAGA